MKITLKNNFHSTEVTLHLKSSFPSKNQVKKAQRTLCGIKGCSCGNIMGMRGPQEGFKIIGQEYSDGQLIPRFSPEIH